MSTTQSGDSGGRDVGDVGSPTDSDAATIHEDAGVMCGGHDATSFPAFDRACASDGDCTIAGHQLDCCGTLDAMGIAASEAAHFGSAESACRAMYPACGCDSGTVRTDDGSMPPPGSGTSAVVVHCVSSVCTTSARAATPCGASTCTPYQVCVMECSGIPRPDAGPLPSHCVDVPAACTGRSDCACFGTNPCPTGSCEGVQNGVPLCLCA